MNKRVISERMILQFRYSKDEVWRPHLCPVIITAGDNIKEIEEKYLKKLHNTAEHYNSWGFTKFVPENPEPEVRVLKTTITETVVSHRKGAV